MRHLIAPACLLLLAACAADPSSTVVASAAPAVAVAASAPAAAASGAKMVCHREEATGSHFSHTVCEPEDQDNSAAKDAARAWADQNTRVNPSAVKTTGH